MRRSDPRSLATAFASVSARAAPATALAGVQGVWTSAVGDSIAREAEPLAEREGTVTITCRSAVWANELELLAPSLVERLNKALATSGGSVPVRQLRFVVSPVR